LKKNQQIPIKKPKKIVKDESSGSDAELPKEQ